MGDGWMGCAAGTTARPDATRSRRREPRGSGQAKPSSGEGGSALPDQHPSPHPPPPSLNFPLLCSALLSTSPHVLSSSVPMLLAIIMLLPAFFSLSLLLAC